MATRVRLKLGSIYDQSKNPDLRIYHNTRAIADLLEGEPYRRAENALRAALRKAANIVKVSAKANVQVDTGALKKSIAVKVSSIKGGAFARIGVVEDRRWLFTKLPKKQDEKRARHLLGRRLKKAEYDMHPRSVVKRPMMYGPFIEREYPFLLPALRRNRNEIIDTLIRGVYDELQKPWRGKSGGRLWRTRTSSVTGKFASRNA